MAELDQLYSPKFKKQLETLQNSFSKLNSDLLQSAKGLKAVDDSLKSVTKTQNNLNNANAQAEKHKQAIIKTDNDIIKKKQQEQKLLIDVERKKQALIKTETTLNREKERQAKNSAKAAKEAQKEASAYYKLNKRLGEARQKAKDLGAATSVGKYSNALKGSVGSMLKFAAGMVGIQMVFRAFGNAIKKIANFEEKMDKLQAVTNETSKGMKPLINDAKRLGSVTSKSASQVAELQIEFAKLGFSTSEILAATEATISLSIAAGSDLAESATVAASTVRGFGLSASTGS